VKSCTWSIKVWPPALTLIPADGLSRRDSRRRGPPAFHHLGTGTTQAVVDHVAVAVPAADGADRTIRPRSSRAVTCTTRPDPEMFLWWNWETTCSRSPATGWGMAGNTIPRRPSAMANCFFDQPEQSIALPQTISVSKERNGSWFGVVRLFSRWQ
jgi:hypothetical protein